MKRREQSLKLLEKAAQDEFVMDKLLADPASPEEAIGFHAQQAAEKLLKAVLANAGIAYPVTHRLAELIDLINDAGLSFPEHLNDIRLLTPFAVEFRYDILPDQLFIRSSLLRQLNKPFITSFAFKRIGIPD